jgi:hypothetical protein
MFVGFLSHLVGEDPQSPGAQSTIEPQIITTEPVATEAWNQVFCWGNQAQIALFQVSEFLSFTLIVLGKLKYFTNLN